ncbi:DUF1428 domain-containing protein [Jannaschia pohangensis]|uniref:Uncharacterized conserved protein YbaA, DUF1428 family n=1 Tax=Jannaschia pohangensis TaxID=390807 RepID=A0A1I3MR98_9RHOB|nr:DUF1428 domain-containing protein [Jannaschia pohangensis]SFI99330.1 Uncharacterized conserved protein YbaA, DUF1428 family [Jannaschia pohangensis]
MSYFSAFVAAVPTAKRDAYIAHAEEAWDLIFKPMGALGMVETWGDDVPEGEVTSFPMAVQCKPDETVVMSWVEWPDKATHDAANAAMMSPDFAPEMAEMPFDGKRVIFGGFAPILTRRA